MDDKIYIFELYFKFANLKLKNTKNIIIRAIILINEFFNSYINVDRLIT